MSFKLEDFDQKVSKTQQIIFSKMASKPKISDLEDSLSAKIYDLLGMKADDDKFVRILDQDDNLLLFHYLVPIDGVRHIRGIIVDVSNRPYPRVVCTSFPYTEEVDVDGPEAQSFPLGHDTLITNAREGTIIRLFNYKDEWILSTHKRINGYNSSWAGKKFGELFTKLWGDYDFDLLDKGKCYAFLIEDPDNRLVCEISKAAITLVAAYCSEGLNMKRIQCAAPPNPNVNVPQYLYIDRYCTLKKAVGELSWNKTTGLLLYHFPSNTAIKIVPLQYNEKRAIRGDQPNLNIRYLELKKLGKVQELIDLYPEYKTRFDTLENELSRLPKYLERCFKQKYIENIYTQFPQEEYLFIRKIRANRSSKSVTSLKEDIENEVNNLEVRVINALLKRVRLEITNTKWVEIVKGHE